MITTCDTTEAGSSSLLFSCLVFLLPALVLTCSVGAGIVEAGILAGMIFHAKPLWTYRHALFHQTRYVVLAFALNLLVAIASLLASGLSANALENPIKEVLIMPVIGLILLRKPRAEWFWYGLFAGTVGAACIAVYQRFGLGWERAQGFQLSIIFGDVAMAMGLMSLASIQLFSGTRLAVLPYASFVAGLCASLLSGTRGGWIALVLSLIPLCVHGKRVGKRKALVAAVAGVSLIVAACCIPQLKVRDRIVQISTDIHQYQLGNADTSVGARFEMWKGAWMLFFEHPLMGVGRANFNQGLNELIAEKEIKPAVRDFRHAHNEMFNMLATEGVVGALTLLFLYAAPFMFFLHRLRRNDACRSYALAGLLLVMSYIDFGLTQVMFVHHVGAAFYAATIGVLAGLCLCRESAVKIEKNNGSLPASRSRSTGKYFNALNRE